MPAPVQPPVDHKANLAAAHAVLREQHQAVRDIVRGKKKTKAKK